MEWFTVKVFIFVHSFFCLFVVLLKLLQHHIINALEWMPQLEMGCSPTQIVYYTNLIIFLLFFVAMRSCWIFVWSTFCVRWWCSSYCCCFCFSNFICCSHRPMGNLNKSNTSASFVNELLIGHGHVNNSMSFLISFTVLGIWLL